MFRPRRVRPGAGRGWRCFSNRAGVRGRGLPGMVADPDNLLGEANFDFSVGRKPAGRAEAPPDNSGFAGSKAEGVGLHNINFDFFEARGFETFRKCPGIDHHHGVEDVEESEDLVIEAVGSGENAARTKDTRGFGEQPVLQCR